MLFNQFIAQISLGTVSIKAKKGVVTMRYDGIIPVDGDEYHGLILKVGDRENVQVTIFKYVGLVSTPVVSSKSWFVPEEMIEDFLLELLGDLFPTTEAPKAEEEWEVDPDLGTTTHTAPTFNTESAVQRVISLGRQNGVYIGHAAATEIVGAVRSSSSISAAGAAVERIARRFGVSARR